MNKKHILVTGSSGMIGSRLTERLLNDGFSVVGIDLAESKISHEKYKHYQTGLDDADAIRTLFEENDFTHIIHLAALAHTEGEKDLSFERYMHVNVDCAKNIFSYAADNRVPILFTSTFDVYGLIKDDTPIGTDYDCTPVSLYAKSKLAAEDKFKRICKNIPHTIMRFAPVYSETSKRDIQKRYYLKYPSVAYRIGKGIEYEVLSLDNALSAIVGWIENGSEKETLNIKDTRRINTKEIIAEEKAAGRAKFVICLPVWAAKCCYWLCRLLFGKRSNKTYLINKAVHPLRTI